MFKKLILSMCVALVPLCVFAEPAAQTSPSENTASPKVTEVTKDENKSLNDLVITNPQFPSVTTTEENELTS